MQYYAIIEETNAYSEKVYKCCICDEEGEVKPLINYAFADRDALEKELDKLKELDLWNDKTFEEVSIEELRLHNALYAVGYKRKNTADVDLDYDRDRRWYVKFISKII